METRQRSPARSAVRLWWLLLTLPPFVGWGALVYAGVRARRRVWTAFGLGYALIVAVGFALIVADNGRDTALSGVAGALFLFAWAAPFIHGLVIASSYLDRLELFEGARFDAAEDRALAREEARRIAARDPRRALELGVGRPDRDGFSGGLVDVNNAPVEAIEGLAGVDRALAERIVKTRDEINGFSSVDDMGIVLDLPAPLVDRIRPDAVFLPRGLRST